MSGWTLVLLLAVAVLGAFLHSACGDSSWLGQRKARAYGLQDSPAGGDLKTKQNLDTALSELRMLREALPASSELRVERRKLTSAPPNGEERRRPRKR